MTVLPQVILAQATPSVSYSDDPVVQLDEQLRHYGIVPPKGMVYDKIVRLQLAEDKPHKLSAWMIAYHLGEKGGIVATFGSWKGNPEKVVWASISDKAMTPQEHIDYKQRIAEADARREQELLRLRAECVKESESIIAKGGKVPANFPYLVKKGLDVPEGIYLHEGKIAVPVLSEIGIHGFEFIHHDGVKRSLVGTDKKGHWFCFKGDEHRVLIAEGWATGASLSAATGATVYTTFGVGNLYDVATWVTKKHPDAIVTICGDLGDIGENKARQTAQALGLQVVFPPEGIEGKDFNDYHAQFGLEALGGLFTPLATRVAAQEENPPADGLLKPQAGFLADVYNYYNATSMYDRKGYALQTAIAVASVILGRRYRTDNNNYSTLYLLNIGTTGVGKDHANAVITAILSACGKINLYSGEGYTSDGAVITALYNQPKHICVWDEFGRSLQAGKMSKDGYGMSAITKLMTAIGRCNNVITSKNYSGAALDKKKVKDVEKKIIHNPALTLLAMSTPETFFEGVGPAMVSDGFAGRLIVYVCKAGRELRKKSDTLPVPNTIENWIQNIYTRCGADLTPDTPEEKPTVEIISIPQSVFDFYQAECEQYFMDMQDDLEKKGKGLHNLVNRSSEMALRLSLIVALSRDPWTKTISHDDMDWSIKYIKACALGAIKEFQRTMYSSEFEGTKLEALEAFRRSGKEGITTTEMNKKYPFAKWRSKDRKEVLDALKEAELIDVRLITGGPGRPKTVYYLLGD